MIHRKKRDIHHKIAFAAGALVMAFAAYTFTTHPGQAIGADAIPGTADPKTTELLNMVNKVKAINLDDTFFRDEVFLSLQDRTVVIEPQPVGKNNPFAPLGSSQASRTTPRQ